MVTLGLTSACRGFSEDVAAEMEDFLHHTKSVVTKGLERHLYLQEEVLVVRHTLIIGANPGCCRFIIGANPGFQSQIIGADPG